MEMEIFGYPAITVIDIETTGLDPQSDDIIEIAAVKIENGAITSKYQTLVKPEKAVPFYISQLTGITDDMLSSAPQIEHILEEFLAFIKNSALCAHNAPFDIGFINQKLILHNKWQLNNPIIDTLPLSRLLFPNLLNHQLETIAELFNIESKRHHRALDDAQATAYILLSFWQLLLSMDKTRFELLEGLATISGIEEFIHIFSAARNCPAFGKVEPPKINNNKLLNLQNSFGEQPQEAIKFEREKIEAFLEKDSPLKEELPAFADRPQQREMMKAVLDSFCGGFFLLAEAGTGVGKSFAYLIPSIFWAVATGERVIISTYTKALQEQLFYCDIPVLSRILPFSFRALLLKGKGNYLCIHRLDRYIKNPPMLSRKDREGLLLLASWLPLTQSGDISENTAFFSHYNSLWEKVKADGHTCIGKNCPFWDACFVFKSRREAHKAQILVVNHSLLLSDISGRTLLGDYKHIIFDEAHNLEKSSIECFSDELSIWRIRSALDGIFSDTPQPSGAIVFLKKELKDFDSELDKLFLSVAQAVVTARNFADTFFSELTAKLEEYYRWRESKYVVKVSYNSSNLVYAHIEPFGRQMISYLHRVRENVEEFLEKVGEPKTKQEQRAYTEFEGEATKIAGIEELLIDILSPDDPDRVYWFESPDPEFKDSNASKICCAPLDIAKILFNELYSNISTSVFTSATMTVKNDFSYFCDRLGISLMPPEKVFMMQLGSPFDYKKQLLVLIPTHLPEPGQNENEYSKKLSELILNVSKELRRGTLVLFTSYSLLENVFRQLHSPFKETGIRLLGQGISGSISAISKVFVDDIESVLLGLESFWQGINIPGESLEILFVTRLPFHVPTEPYIEAIQNRIRSRGGEPFSEYLVPQAVIRFRQGIGRLIRSETDKGVLIILDKRIISRDYGRSFLQSLPAEAQVIETHNTKAIIEYIREHFDKSDAV